jgi:c-di-GMP-binding flagellar brake protein YcgR
MMLGQENRVNPRAELKWHVSAEVNNTAIEGATKDISAGGAYVCCANPLRLNEVFNMVIDAPNKSLIVQAEVVWSNIYGIDDDINPRGMGVRFLEITDEDQRIISKAVNERNQGKVALESLETAILDAADTN